MEPVRVTSLSTGNPTSATVAVGNNLPKDIEADISRFISDTDVSSEDVAVIYKYLTLTYPELTMKDIQEALEGKPVKDVLKMAVDYFKRNPNPIKTHIKFLDNSLDTLRDQANETGNWSHYLKVAQEKKKYANGNIS